MLNYFKKGGQLQLGDSLCYFFVSSDADGSISSPRHAVSCIPFGIFWMSRCDIKYPLPLKWRALDLLVCKVICVCLASQGFVSSSTKSIRRATEMSPVVLDVKLSLTGWLMVIFKGSYNISDIRNQCANHYSIIFKIYYIFTFSTYCDSFTSVVNYILEKKTKKYLKIISVLPL